MNECANLLERYGRKYIFHQLPFVYSLEITSPKFIKTAFSDVIRFPKSSFFFPSGSVVTKLLSKSLIAVDGKLWKVQRRNFDPAFKKSFLIGMVPQFQELAMKVVREWEQIDGSKPVPIQDYFLKLTIDAIGNFLSFFNFFRNCWIWL